VDLVILIACASVLPSLTGNATIFYIALRLREMKHVVLEQQKSCHFIESWREAPGDSAEVVAAGSTKSIRWRCRKDGTGYWAGLPKSLLFFVHNKFVRQPAGAQYIFLAEKCKLSQPDTHVYDGISDPYS
jgi:hypothetical protein